MNVSRVDVCPTLSCVLRSHPTSDRGFAWMSGHCRLGASSPVGLCRTAITRGGAGETFVAFSRFYVSIHCSPCYLSSFAYRIVAMQPPGQCSWIDLAELETESYRDGECLGLRHRVTQKNTGFKSGARLALVRFRQFGGSRIPANRTVSLADK